jgi:hypothetical protein
MHDLEFKQFYALKPVVFHPSWELEPIGTVPTNIHVMEKMCPKCREWLYIHLFGMTPYKKSRHGKKL